MSVDIEKQTNYVKTVLDKSLQVIRLYESLLDYYVLDYFTESHWEKLLPSWQESLKDMHPQDMGDILSGRKLNHMLPLSLLSLMKFVKTWSIGREVQPPSKGKATVSKELTSPTFKFLFLKHVKLKKRHEISLMADVVANEAAANQCGAVLDFGSGMGHLVRVLAYKYKLQAAGIERQPELIAAARELDAQLCVTSSKHLSETEQSIVTSHTPEHISLNLKTEDDLAQLQLKKSLEEYGLIGLHPCGDLGPLLLKHFVKSSNVKFICVVGCCYMKLTCNEDGGYPLSRYVQGLAYELSYRSREIACHAVEVYCERLRKGKYEELKIHAYRAALERILVEYNPELRHAPVRSIKHSQDMTFQSYCTLALDRLNIPLPTSDEIWSRAEQDLTQWRRVVVVYTLRLALAQLVETVVLLDRLLYVLEHGISCEIRPVFDPMISPRNHIIIGRKPTQ